MEKAHDSFPEWDRNPRMPVPPPPSKSCDCQFHIYEDPAKYPPRKGTTYDPPDAKFADMQRVLKTIGFQRGVIVHPTTYGADHRLLLDTLESLPPDTRKNFRAVAIINDTVSDSEMARLDKAGVRAARLNFMNNFAMTPTPDQARRTFARLREIGWHARIHVKDDDVLTFSDVLKEVTKIPMVIDHLGHPGFSGGLNRPNVQWILNILKRDNWWMMASNGNRGSEMDRGWDDAVPYGTAFIQAAPDRAVWGTDWPHVSWTKRMMNEAEPVELLYRYVDNDKALLQKVLVDNPARLHGFKD